jgi:dGTPase
MTSSPLTALEMRLQKIRRQLDDSEQQRFSDLATPSVQALRRCRETRLDHDYRQAFAVDVDRILHSRSYTRYIDKTQVFYLIRNDHITHRVLHVQLVSKIARTIGRFLRLNEDLIEAIALGHDIGHAPFGHDGERILSELCLEHGIGHFLHNLQSVQFLERVERKGRGWNLTLQTLDGILAHDGEVHDRHLAPCGAKTFEDLETEMAAKQRQPDLRITPMTMEGCVVRMADTISYVGRDIEDAIRLGVVTREEIPEESARVLGRTNGAIVYSLVTDILAHSHGQPYLSFSAEVSAALKRLKAFNLERIYLNQCIKCHGRRIAELFRLLFERYLDDIRRDRRDSVIFRSFLHDMAPEYLERHRPAEIVRDFIAGMTDRYFLEQCPPEQRPEPVAWPVREPGQRAAEDG